MPPKRPARMVDTLGDFEDEVLALDVVDVLRKVMSTHQDAIQGE